MLRKTIAASVGVFAAAALSLAASASVTIDLGGGWSATIFDPENVALEVDFVGPDFIVIEKFANFVEVDPFTGLPVPVAIAFNQNAPDNQTVPRIIITEEFAFNNTPVDWTSFRMSLLGSNARFNPAASANFSIDPYTSMTFIEGNSEVVFSGGVVASGDVWNPGHESGGLVIDVDLSSQQPVKFLLKEIPVPAPGALALLGVAAIASRRRRRN